MNGKRRVAKAYARAPVLTIDGSHDGFDGYRIGLNGFENPLLDVKTEEVMRYIGKFKTNVSRELRSAYPNRKKLENQCLSCIAFVRNSPNILDLPVYIMIINIVALDLLKSKLTLIPYTIRQKSQKSSNMGTTRIPDWVSLFDRHDKHGEEDPYSLPANGSSYDSSYYANNGTLLKKSTLREPKPPKLPPRDFGKYKNNKNPIHKLSTNQIQIPTPDYSQEEDFYTITPKTLKKKPLCNKRDEDPYYCGLEARVTNFMRPVPTQSKKSVAWRQMRKVFSSGYINTLLPPLTKKKRSKSYYYNSSESDPYASLNDTIYEPIYGRVSSNYSTNKYKPSTVRSRAYVTDWQNHY
ncbi:unnamed protein product [Oppiella nova]|uniref:MH2 domain-containing protein n=1 Tax=Oppiella nova TaxID=334625 RepID=A0A7R9QEM8_9ACAR|nr:unnamed protein product [Oppiella nova]CAG2163503.1 unnamed protein product [Oppiella nova]